jgi:hypothetical protein
VPRLAWELQLPDGMTSNSIYTLIRQGVLLHLPRAVLIDHSLGLPFDLTSCLRAVQLHPSLIDRHRSPDIPLDQVHTRGLCAVAAAVVTQLLGDMLGLCLIAPQFTML